MKFVEVATETQALAVAALLPDVLALDCETDALETRKAALDCIVLATADAAYKIPAHMVPLFLPRILTCKMLYLQNFKYDYKVLYHHGYNLLGVPFRDTMLLHHLIDENKEHGLDAMVQEHFADNYKSVFWGKYEAYADAPHDEALEYVCKDGIYTHRLASLYLGELYESSSLVEHVHRLALALLRTEFRGVRVDLPTMLQTRHAMGMQIDAYLPAMRDSLLHECTLWEMQAWEKLLDKVKTPKGKAAQKRPTFSFGSDSQVSWLVYQALKLPVLKRTKKTPKGGGNNPSVDAEAIGLLAEKEPRLKVLADYKAIKNHYATFVVGMIDRVEDNRIYPEFNVNGTETGRISHSNPNLGNLPTEGPYRGFFEADGMWVGADFTQLEVVIEANLSGDKVLRDMILSGASKHDITAKNLGITRDEAKPVNFAMQYWGTYFVICRLLKVSKAEGQHIWNKYWETYKGVRELKAYTDRLVHAGEPIVNLFGRARHVPHPDTWQWSEYYLTQAKYVGSLERQGYNALIQGTGADMTHTSFYLSSERLEANKHGKAVFEVHDEILLDIEPPYVEEESTALVKCMESMTERCKFEIPIRAKPSPAMKKWSKT